MYLLPNSCHPRQVMKHIPYSLALRLRRICSNDHYFQKHAEALKEHLLAGKYNRRKVSEAIQRAKDISRLSLLEYKTKVPKSTSAKFITTFHPARSNIKTIVQKFSYILEYNENLQKIFEHPPLAAYKRPRTLGNILSKTFLCNHDENAALGFHHCTKSNCSTRSHSSISTFFQSFSNNKEFHILKSIDCDSSNHTYLINCFKRGKQYVGETGRKLTLERPRF